MNTFDYRQGLAYMRDSFIPFSKATLSVASSPILYGLSVYTVCRVTYNPEDGTLYGFRLKDHYDRLVASAKVMDFHNFITQWSYERFETMIRDLVKKNKIKETVLVRISVFVDELIAGTRIHGLTHSLSAYVYPIGEILPPKGAHVCVSSWRRNLDNAIPSRAKVNGGYANVSLMKNEALQNGFDDAISLDNEGHVCEGTVSNLFLVKNGSLVTPHTGSDILEGITRNSILTIAQDLGIEVSERTIDRTELYIADEAFFTGSSATVIPLLSIDKRPLGKKIGPVSDKIKTAYIKTFIDPTGPHSNWLTKI